MPQIGSSSHLGLSLYMRSRSGLQGFGLSDFQKKGNGMMQSQLIMTSPEQADRAEDIRHWGVENRHYGLSLAFAGTPVPNYVAGGNVIGIPQFRKDFGKFYNDDYVLDGDWQSAINGGPNASAAIGTLLSAYGADKIGRKWMLMVGCLIGYVGITLEVTATSIAMFFAGKFINGFAIGVYSNCAKHNIYTILDLHSAPGGQNEDWHSDNPGNHASFWDHKHFQDRTVHLWKVIASRYKDNTWVAGYDPLNEPADSEGYRIAKFYDVLVKGIREVDENHILFLEGNGFGTDFTPFSTTYSNTAWSIHDYCFYAFPHGGIGTYDGLKEQDEFIRKQYEQKIEFMKERNVPIWNGEFGIMYEKEEDNPDWIQVNKKRYNMLEKQIAMYTAEGIAWSIWSYKDINIMGMLHLSPDSPWWSLLRPIITKKKSLVADCAYGDSHLEPVFGPLHNWFEENVPEKYRTKYPPQIPLRQQVTRATRDFVLSDYLVPEWADYFRGLGEKELDELAGSWKYGNCVRRGPLESVIGKYARMEAGDERLGGRTP
ncbi:glycoside hydrolase superfamily [Aspergillus karnatakaensis]|uniref:glycoside hydrolase superfamily n=1 Tax=Aspergillus karnatakaensis TaxID=1810916 RepID=UPI003CCD1D67